MDNTSGYKRMTPDEFDLKIPEPVLVRVNKHGCSPHDIRIDKNEFKIGRARDNDEIILDPGISRRHCVLRCEGNQEWTIKDFSSSTTFVNNAPLAPGDSRRISDGDVIQFSISTDFKYTFTLATKGEPSAKRPRMDEQILDNVLVEQKTFAENQECQKKVLKDKLQEKHNEQIHLKLQLEELLMQRNAAKEDTEDLKKQITTLEGRIKSGNVQEKHLHNMYSELLEKLENERVQFEERLNKEKQKWQEALDMSKQEKETLEARMKEQMEKWRVEQQTEWKNAMENRVREEKDIQAQLLTEKTELEEKLKETEKALKEQEAKAVAGSAGTTSENCVLVEIIDVDNTSQLRILDTIDLTGSTQLHVKSDTDEGIIPKVSDIMEEQLTCSVCSELFVNATTLNCMHTFCQHCINSWSKKRKECPICRAPVRSMNRSLVLDNFIECMMQNLSVELQERRNELVQERKVLDPKKKKYR